MAKYLRPRRGSKANAVAQKILLKKGEMFMEFPNSEIGKGPGRIIMGDGATSYQNMDYGTTATNVFRPFITDPEIFIPHFTNTNPSTASWTVNSGTAAIAKMGDGSAASTVTLPTIIGAVKETLCKHADSITKLNNDLGDISSHFATFYKPYFYLFELGNGTTLNINRGTAGYDYYIIIGNPSNSPGICCLFATTNNVSKYDPGNKIASTAISTDGLKIVINFAAAYSSAIFMSAKYVKLSS